MIDLHIHSTASDGTFSAIEIVKMAFKLRLKAISITDHDTIDGATEAIQSGIPENLNFVPGIEISASPPEQFPCSGSFHILGYFIQLQNQSLNQTLKTLQEARKNRNPLIIQRLNDLGIDISINDIIVNASNGQIGRPHIAKALISKGVVRTINEAFDTYLGKGKPAYVDKFRFTSEQAIDMILKAGGIPVLAHPVLIKPTNNQPIEYLIEILKGMGLKGLEVYYSDHTELHVKQYSNIAKQFDLLETGGTDFHGNLKPDIMIGSGRGNMSIPDYLYQKLFFAAQLGHDPKV